MKLSEKLLQEAIEAIDMITDPIAKIDAISKVIPYIIKEYNVETDGKIPELEKEFDAPTVSESVVSETKEEAKEETFNEAVVAEAVKEAVAETKEFTHEDFVQKFIEENPDLSFSEAIRNPDKIVGVDKDINKIKDLKTALISFYKNCFPQLDDHTAESYAYDTIAFYMKQYSEDEGLKDYTAPNDIFSNIKVKYLLGKFNKFMDNIINICEFKNDEIKSTVRELTHKANEGIKSVNPENARVVYIMLKEKYQPAA